MEREFTCQRCNILVVQIISDPSDEPLYCLECRFIEGIENPEAKKQVADFIDAKNGN